MADVNKGESHNLIKQDIPLLSLVVGPYDA
jgi:hypothetical protein